MPLRHPEPIDVESKENPPERRVLDVRQASAAGLVLAGALLVTTGAAILSVPAGIIVAGIVALTLGVLLGFT